MSVDFEVLGLEVGDCRLRIMSGDFLTTWSIDVC